MVGDLATFPGVWVIRFNSASRLVFLARIDSSPSLRISSPPPLRGTIPSRNMSLVLPAPIAMSWGNTVVGARRDFGS